VPAPSVVFDETGQLLVYPTLLGIKVVNLTSNGVARLLGKVENTERFLRLALYQGVPKKVGVAGWGVGSGFRGGGAVGRQQPLLAACASGGRGASRREGSSPTPPAQPLPPSQGGLYQPPLTRACTPHPTNLDPDPAPSQVKARAHAAEIKLPERDPTIVATAYRKQRFYLFTRREPTDAEDAAVRAFGGWGVWGCSDGDAEERGGGGRWARRAQGGLLLGRPGSSRPPLTASPTRSFPHPLAPTPHPRPTPHSPSTPGRARRVQREAQHRGAAGHRRRRRRQQPAARRRAPHDKGGRERSLCRAPPPLACQPNGSYALNPGRRILPHSSPHPFPGPSPPLPLQGDISLRLFPDECPRTIENFTTHARNGYYDGVIFHRVIKGFMLQAGWARGARFRRAWADGRGFAEAPDDGCDPAASGRAAPAGPPPALEPAL
jgi:hypothetical protein